MCIRDRYHPASGFALITSRAFSDLADFVARSRHLLAVDGRWLAMKGVWPKAEFERLPDSIAVDAVHRLAVPGVDGERHLVVLRCTDAPLSLIHSYYVLPEHRGC